MNSSKSLGQECSSCKELYSENLELKEALAKTSQLTTAYNIVSASPTADSIDCNSNHTVDDILDFEFPFPSRTVRKHVIHLGDDEKIWFSSKIDTKTGNVISCNPGRIKQSEITEIAKGANV